MQYTNHAIVDNNKQEVLSSQIYLNFISRLRCNRGVYDMWNDLSLQHDITNKITVYIGFLRTI